MKFYFRTHRYKRGMVFNLLFGFYNRDVERSIDFCLSLGYRQFIFSVSFPKNVEAGK